MNCKTKRVSAFTVGPYGNDRAEGVEENNYKIFKIFLIDFQWTRIILPEMSVVQ
jgi:hypothetical protein